MAQTLDGLAKTYTFFDDIFVVTRSIKKEH